jgi:magnesium-transporting ATPase (P-type)
MYIVLFFWVLGTAVAVLVVLILIVKFCVIEFGIKGKAWETDKTAKYIETFVYNFIIGVTVLVVAVPEGLPLAVTLALAYSVRVRRIRTMQHFYNLEVL